MLSTLGKPDQKIENDDDTVDLIYIRPADRASVDLQAVSRLLGCVNDSPVLGVPPGLMQLAGYDWLDGANVRVTIRMSPRAWPEVVYQRVDFDQVANLITASEQRLN